ncbi:MAG: sodium/solute symporter [Phycisphaerales bacterium]|nr:sodium/solute symporter [Phycisphaerales bacterium]
MPGTPLLLAAFSSIDWLVLLAYLAAVVIIGWVVSRRQKSEEDYFLAGRRMPAWAVALSILATSLSAATFVGVPQLSYNGDLSYLILTPGGLIAVVVIAFLFIPAFYRAGTITIYGYLDQRFGGTSRIAVSIMFLVGRLLASGARLFVAAIPVTLILFGTEGFDRTHLAAAVVLLGVVGTFYTAIGGIRAVIWTDVVQIIVVVGVAVLSIVLLLRAIHMPVSEIIDMLRHAGPDDASKLRIVDASPALSKSFTVWTGVFAIVFMNMGSYGVDHDLAQRMLTCKSAWRGGLSLVASNLVAIPVVLLFLVIGLLLFVYYNTTGDGGGELSESFKVYPQYLLDHLPIGLAGLAMAGLFAAAMSSFDSAVGAMAASWMTDLYQPICRRFAEASEDGSSLAAPRLTVVVMGALLTLFAVCAAAMYDPKQTSLIDFVLGIMAYAYAGMLGVFLTALLTKRGNTCSVLAALVAGAGVVVMLQPGICSRWMTWMLGSESIQSWPGSVLLGDARTIAWPWWMVIGTAVSFVVCVAGRPNRTTFKERTA